jgi:hypothetical protein
MTTNYEKLKTATYDELMNELEQIDYEFSVNGGFELSGKRIRELYSHKEAIEGELKERGFKI